MSDSMLNKCRDFTLSSRILTTRLAVVVPCILVLVTGSGWEKNGFADILFESVGLILVVLGAFGRLWASMYVSGYKNRDLVTQGPYSVVRNPLYLFSFIGATGIAFSSGSLLIVAMIVVAFVFYYRLVVAREEADLASNHAASFTQYSMSTPRFIPRLSLFHEPDTYLVNTKVYRRAFLDAMFFIWGYGILQMVGKMHELNILPTVLRIF